VIKKQGTLSKLWRLLGEKQRRGFIAVVILSVLFSIVELIAISLIMPFVQAATDFTQIQEKPYLAYLYKLLGAKSEINFIVLFGVLLLLFYLFRALFALWYYYKLSSFVRHVYHYFASKLFSKYIHMHFRDYIEKNSAHMTQVITQEAEHLVQLMYAVILTVGEIFVVLMIYMLLLAANWKLTLLLTLFLLVNGLFLSRYLMKRIKAVGERRSREHRRFYEILSTTFGNFRMIKLRGDEQQMQQRFSKASQNIVDAYVASETMHHVPRLYLEAISFMLLVSIVLYWVLTYHSDISGMIGVLTLFLVALYRLMPSFNRILTNLNTIKFHESALKSVRKEMATEEESVNSIPLTFDKRITLRDISFGYNKEQKVLDKVNLVINKGESVAFVGESGGGKSTLVDIVCGLLRPDEGGIYVDDAVLNESNMRSWRQKIGYIPQDVYLFDATVAENVTFLPRDEIDEARLTEVLKQAQIYDFLQKHQQGIDTIVGEDGIKLSGGQKQRIAIARALYHDPEIIVMDEATSALDEATEKAIMQRIYEIGKEKTLIMIAHRLSTIERCDRVYQVGNGKVNLS